MTSTQQHSDPVLQQTIVDELAEDWLDLIEDDSEESPTFAEALKGWYDNQMQELHDSRGDAEYQEQIVGTLQAFRTMIQQVQQFDFGFETMDQEVAEETKA